MAKCAVSLFLGHTASFHILAFKNMAFSFSVSVFLSLSSYHPLWKERRKQNKCFILVPATAETESMSTKRSFESEKEESTIVSQGLYFGSAIFTAQTSPLILFLWGVG